jgi:two-component system NtrC family sensor kinase
MDEPRRIMIVEDSCTQALKLQLLLEQQGWDVVHAPTAEAAMSEIGRGAPHLILVDYYLPGIRGDELCRKIRMNINTRGIPIIMLTSENKSGTEIHGLESGADDFLQKSADPDILLLRIRKWLDKSSTPSSVLEHGDSCFPQARLLTIDDSETYLAYLAVELAEDGYLVEQASSPERGLELLAAREFDCVLVDLVMPGIDGIEVCRRVNQMRGRSDNPIGILMLTAQENKEDLTRALEAGADDFVGKSSDMAVLKGRIRALLRRKFYQEENRRILEELKNKELEAVKARAEKEAADARAVLYEELQQVAAELQRSKDELLVSEEQLRAANATLEQRVAQRTKQLQEHVEELKRTNAELDQFAHVASHDLQEPLRKVQMFGDFLSSECGSQLGDDGQDYLNRILHAIARMRTLINDLLAFSRLTRSRQPFLPLDLEAVAREVISDLQVRIEETRGRVDVGRLPRIEAEPTQMRQLLQNLICNALKFHHPGEPPVVKVHGVTSDGMCRIVVEDNGIGFEQKYAERIFEPFKRLHGCEDYDGTGIGLAICRKIAERHGGSITAESRPGQGAHFIVTLPVHHPRDVAEAAGSGPEAGSFCHDSPEASALCENRTDHSPSSSPTMMPTTVS